MPAKRKPIPVHQRSALSNGQLLLNGIPADGRTVIGRRFRDHVAALSDHVGEPTHAEDMLIRRAAFLATLCDVDETAATGGKEIDQGLYVFRINALAGLLSRLGLSSRRVMRPVNALNRPDDHAASVLEGFAEEG